LKIPSQAVLGRSVDELPLEIRENNPNVDTKKTISSVVYRYIKDDKNGFKAVVTPVKIGPSDATHTIIKSGLTKDDQVVVGPYKVLEGLKHEQKIKDEKEVEKEKKEKEKKKAKLKDKEDSDRTKDDPCQISEPDVTSDKKAAEGDHANEKD